MVQVMEEKSSKSGEPDAPRTSRRVESSVLNIVFELCPGVLEHGPCQGKAAKEHKSGKECNKKIQKE